MELSLENFIEEDIPLDEQEILGLNWLSVFLAGSTATKSLEMGMSKEKAEMIFAQLE